VTIFLQFIVLKLFYSIQIFTLTTAIIIRLFFYFFLLSSKLNLTFMFIYVSALIIIIDLDSIHSSYEYDCAFLVKNFSYFFTFNQIIFILTIY
jgi:hypothetical protein